ncbi:helix-turn-helix domain-containing protein [Sabulibacter ruber]|uniref:helix-turn-helix domain-containing protein n=1 Tax=Sabulibacter ruber TaxID=2811901 RepID=UPI001F61A210|nr:helix-turn-helix transcriptional regulator [Sabulibacter ruber]
MHLGRKISRIRELRGIKQEAMAQELGVSQQTVSRIESSDMVEEEMLARIAKVLEVTPEVIKHFNEEAVFNIIGNTVNNNDNAALFNYYPTFNPVDKIVSLYDEKIALLERLLQSEREKIELYKSFLKD